MSTLLRLFSDKTSAIFNTNILPDSGYTDDKMWNSDACTSLDMWFRGSVFSNKRRQNIVNMNTSVNQLITYCVTEKFTYGAYKKN